MNRIAVDLHMELEKNKIKLIVQRRIVIFSVILFVGKLTAYFLTNSVGILTDALESTVNVITGFISLYSISVALKPRDANHPFGHGKIESLSASLEGILILLAGLVIIFEAIKRLFNPIEIQQLDIGIIIITVTGVVNYILGYYSIKIGRKHDSIALVSGGKHLQSDTYSTIGLVVGLVLLLITKLAWLDSTIAILFGLIIIFTGYKILKETTSNLMDEADLNVLNEIVEILMKNKSTQWIDIHNLKLIKYGDTFHIDCDLTLPWFMNIAQAHKETDLVMKIISDNYAKKIDFTIHIDECKPNFCKQCRMADCTYRTQEFSTDVDWTLAKIIKTTDSNLYDH